MLSNPELFTSATKALFESQIAAFTTLSDKTMKGLEKAIALNMAAAKEYAEESNVAVQRLFSAKDPQTFLELASTQAKSAAEKMASYNRDLSNIATELRAECSKAAEDQLQETKNKMFALVDDATRNTPAGSEPMAAMMKLAIDAASVSYEQLTTATKQALETVEAQAVKTTQQFSPIAEKTVHKTTHITSRK